MFLYFILVRMTVEQRRRHPKSVDQQLLGGRQLPQERISPNSKPKRVEYSLEKDVGINYFAANSDNEIDERPTALCRWSFDDYVSEQIWSAGQCGGSGSSGSDDVCFVDITSEGIPDSVIVKQLQQRLGIHHSAAANAEQRILLTTPCDFVGVAVRRALLPRQALSAPAFRDVQTLQDARGGTAHVTPAKRMNGLQAANSEAALVPEAIRHTIVLRSCSAGMSSIFDRVQRIQRSHHGVANYSEVAQHGYHLHRAFSSGLQLLQRDHLTFFTRHLTELAEGSSQVAQDIDRVASILSTPSSGEYRLVSEWKAIAASLHVSTSRAKSTVNNGNTGLYAPHLDALNETIARISAMPSSAKIDSAKLIRECVSRRVLQDRLRSLTDVHFNAWTSLRMHTMPSVQIGDVVLACNGMEDRAKLSIVSRLDPRTTRRDHAYSMGEHLHYTDSTTSYAPPLASGDQGSAATLRVIATDEEAARYRLDDVVVPLFGRDAALPLASGESSGGLVFPQHRFGKATSDELAQRLQLDSLRHMKLAAPAGYRPVAVMPRNLRCFMVDDVRNVQHGDDVLAQQTFIDREGIRRLRSPLEVALGRSSKARPGISESEARKNFVGLATRPGFTVVLQFELPVGSSSNSVLREIVKARTVDPSRILQSMMQASVMRHRRR